jgi:hypothetical protein
MNWLRKNRVLVPVDFSEESFKALLPAREFVEDASQYGSVKPKTM